MKNGLAGGPERRRGAISEKDPLVQKMAIRLVVFGTQKLLTFSKEALTPT
jgi:hypothetical protein